MSVNLGTGALIEGVLPDVSPEQAAIEAARAAQDLKENRRRNKLRSLKQKFRDSTANAADRDKALAILCGMALQDLAEDADNGT